MILSRISPKSCLLALILPLAAAMHQAHADAPPAPSPTEQWALGQIENGQDIDFSQHCPSVVPSVDPGSADDACRTISGKFLTQLLRGDLVAPAFWPHGAIRMRHAYVKGTVDLTAGKINGVVDIESTSFDSPVFLDEAEFTHSLIFRSDFFASHDTSKIVLSLPLVTLHGNFDLDNSLINGQFLMDHATIQGDATLDEDRFLGKVDAHAANIGAFLYVHQLTSEDTVQFGNARIGTSMMIDCVDAQKTVYIDAVSVNTNLYIEGHFEDKNHPPALSAAALTVGGRISIQAEIDGSIDLHDSVIKGNIALTTAPGKPPNKIGAINGEGIDVGHNLTFAGVIFLGTIDLSDAQIGDDFSMKGDTWQTDASKAIVSIKSPGIDIGHNLAFSNSVFLGTIDLSNAQVGGEFSIRQDKPLANASLLLGNAHVGMLDDDETSWPANHELSGFTYDDLSGHDSGLLQLERDMDWRLNWLPRERDHLPDVAPDSYKKFAAALVKAGDLQDSNRVLYNAQLQAEYAAFNGGQYFLWAKFFLLRWLVGYGIGVYTFRVLIWVALLTTLGALVLHRNERAKQKGTIWCIEASLDRLLPIVQLSPEFDEFFKDPDAVGLKPWQVTVFAVVAIIGWGLGLFLAAAISGLTQAG